MALQGEKFELNLENQDSQRGLPAALAFGLSMVTDIKEKEISSAPTAPVFKTNTGGFPAHRKRTPKAATTRFATNNTEIKPLPKAEDAAVAQPAKPPASSSAEDQERQQIDEENKARLAAMSEEEIQEEREQLMKSLSSGLLERLLKRATIEEDSGGFDSFQQEPVSIPEIKVEPADEDVHEKTAETSTKEAAVGHTKDSEKIEEEKEETEVKPSHSRSVHFPNPPTVPDLDPSSPDFLESLKQTYYPTLSHDPNKLSWMQDPNPSQSSSYSPSLESVTASALRFDFRGNLLPPSTSATIPVTAGLHHHGDAPDSAGYTLPELAHLARSTVPAQRCIAYQTLGRLLYRMGKNAWGDEVGEGLEDCVKRGRVIDTLLAAAGEGKDGEKHLSARQYAIEAVWLWRKGLGDEEVKLPSGKKGQSATVNPGGS